MPHWHLSCLTGTSHASLAPFKLYWVSYVELCWFLVMLSLIIRGHLFSLSGIFHASLAPLMPHWHLSSYVELCWFLVMLSLIIRGHLFSLRLRLSEREVRLRLRLSEGAVVLPIQCATWHVQRRTHVQNPLARICSKKRRLLI